MKKKIRSKRFTRHSALLTCLTLFTLHVSRFTVEACSSCIGWLKDRPLWDNGFVLSTMLIMFTPVAVLGAIGGWIFHVYRSRATTDEQHETPIEKEGE